MERSALATPGKTAASDIQPMTLRSSSVLAVDLPAQRFSPGTQTVARLINCGLRFRLAADRLDRGGYRNCCWR